MIPLLTETFLNYLKKLNIKNKKYLEIGSGDSTVYFSKYFKSVSSLEHDEEWFNKIKKQNIKNVNISMFNKDNIKGLLDLELNKKPDFVMIDNNPHVVSRFDMANFVHYNKKNDCVIFLDNGSWNLEAFNFLKQHYYCLDFFGRRYDGNLSVTSIFFTDTNSESIYEN
tara:strand:+ start:1121 stop:1624 length:504 start_codon:yes stop_codon:yes gene_type:complete